MYSGGHQTNILWFLELCRDEDAGCLEITERRAAKQPCVLAYNEMARAEGESPCRTPTDT